MPIAPETYVSTAAVNAQTAPLKRIPVRQARVGMFLHKIEGSWLTNPFWRNEFLLAEDDQIGKLQQSAVQSIWIDLSRGLDVLIDEAAENRATRDSASSALTQARGETGAPLEGPEAPEDPRPAGSPAEDNATVQARATRTHGFDPRAPREPAKPGSGFDPRAPREPAKPGSGFDPRAPREMAQPGPGFDPRKPREPVAAGLAQADAAWTASPANTPKREPTAPLDSEMQRASGIVRDVRTLVGGLYESARLGHALDAERCLPLVDSVNDSVNRNPDALLTLTRLRKRDEYTYMHSVAVCALMVALGREMGLDADTCREAGLAGLLHDVGRIGAGGDDDPDHALRGAQMLAALRLAPAIVAAVRDHHGPVDGSAVAGSRSGPGVSELARIVGIADAFDDTFAAAGPNASLFEVMRRLAEISGGRFAVAHVRALLRLFRV